MTKRVALLVLPTAMTAVGLAALPRAADAHDLWLVSEPRSLAAGAPFKLLAQTGMKFPESVSALAPERLDAAFVVDAAGRRELRGGTTRGKSLAFEARVDTPGVAVAAASVKPNFIHIKAADFNEYLKLDGLPQILELRKAKGQLGVDGREIYAKFAKAVLRVGEGGPADLATKPVGLKIEIVPLADPYGVAGGKLPVQVLFEGRPLDGVFVYRLFEGEEKYVDGLRTDGEGKTAVAIDRPGLWSLHCIYMRPYSDKQKADWESFFATVSFVAK
jgi:hypothetical protein